MHNIYNSAHMAESQNGTSSSANPKEKNSVLDEDIGKEFLGSWKSISVTEDDGMDFNFEPVSKGKKNTFNFDKLDMDFNLGSDFGKMSSFNVDMTDLDFSSPPKKNAKPKEKSQEESTTGKHQGKQNNFSFSFDFNELDDFNFDSNFTEGDKKSKKGPDSKKAAANISDCQAQDFKMDLPEGVSAIDDRASTKHPPSESVTTTKAENLVSSLESHNTISENPPAKSATVGNLVVPQEVRNSLEKTATITAEETDEQNHQSQKTIFSEPKAQDTILNIPVHSVSMKNSSWDTVSELQTEVGLLNRRVNTSSIGKQNVDAKMTVDQSHQSQNTTSTEPKAQDTILNRPVHSLSVKNSTQDTVSELQTEVGLRNRRVDTGSGGQQNVDAKMIVDSSQQSEKTVFAEQKAHDTILNMPVHSVSMKNSTRDTVSELQTDVGLLNRRVDTGSGGKQNVDAKMVVDMGSNHELLKLQTSSPPHITELQSSNSERNKLGCNNHAPLESTDGTEPFEGDLDLEGTSTSSVSKRTLHDAKGIREFQNFTSKLPLATLSSNAMTEKKRTIKEKDTGVIRSRFFKRSEETEPQLQQASSTQTKNFLSGNNIIRTVDSSLADKKREDSNANDAQIQSNMVGTSRSHVGGLTTDEPFLLGDEKKATNSNDISFQVNPSSPIEKTTNSSTKKCVNPKLVVPSMASMRKIVSVERNKLSSFKAAIRTPDLSNLNISGSIGAKSRLSNSTFEKEFRSLRNSEQRMSVPSKMSHSVGTEKQAPTTPSLKRKICESSYADIVTSNPLKRLSESSSESRIKEAPEIVVQEQVCNYENQGDSNINKSFCDPATPTFDIPQDVSMTELDIPLVLEKDGTVEKAEAYTKELENICSMLKKKHEEAKELLVRAIVNNNNLLMLNHPIYEEKIHTVQKFATRLMSK